MNTVSTYRADIDGLRAVAVLSVVIYHLGLDFLPGGFSGVDVFFVISGYLITSIISREMESGTFTFVKFYQRRIRRIVPALVFVLIATMAAGYILLLPTHYENLGESTFFSGLGLANIYFFYNTGYFDQAAEQLPLLHMWSLAIEEQFYIFWPVLLLAIFRFGQSHARNAAIALGVIIVVSFAWSEYAAFTQPKAAFFLPHLRAWELALGSLLAFSPTLRGRLWSEVAATIGLGLILVGILSLSEEGFFPGHNALYPCLGAALVIWPKEHKTVVAHILAFKPAVGIGLISYSLYLWHWPILVFYRYYIDGEALTPLEMGIMFAASVGLSIFSFFLVERPFRRPWQNFTMPWQAAGASLLISLCLGAAIVLSSGVPQRLSTDVRTMEAYLDYKKENVSGFCRPKLRKAGWSSSDCLYADPDRPRVLLLGDSHLTHFSNALSEEFPDIAFTQINYSGCRPVLKPVSERKPNCVEQTIAAYNELLPQGMFDAVFISARWRNGEWEQVGETVEHAIKYVPLVVVIGQNLEYDHPLPEILMGSVVPRRGRPTPDSASRLAEARSINEGLRPLVEAAGGVFYDPLAVVCDGDDCISIDENGAPFLRDKNHFTYEGSLQTIRHFTKDGLFEPVLPK